MRFGGNRSHGVMVRLPHKELLACAPPSLSSGRLQADVTYLETHETLFVGEADFSFAHAVPWHIDGHLLAS